jgi:hypothetical protein
VLRSARKPARLQALSSSRATVVQTDAGFLARASHAREE